jgi:ferritin
MTEMLSTNLVELFKLQISHELYNSQFYTKVGMTLKNMGLDNIGNHFYDTQREEEQGHKKLLCDYLIDRNINVEIIPIPEVNFNFTTMSDVASQYLALEMLTTARLKEIAKVALIESDFITFGFVTEMINIQRVEESEALSFKDKITLINDDMKVVLLFDANFSL